MRGMQSWSHSLFECVEEGCNRTDILAVGNGFAFEFQAGFGAGLTLEVVTKHFLTLCAVVEADLNKIYAGHGVCVKRDRNYSKLNK